MKSAEWPVFPVLKRHLRVERRDPKHVLISDGVASHVLSDSSCYKLMPLLDGSRTIDDLCEELRDVELVDLLGALERLAQLGLLASRQPNLPAEQEAFWQAVGGQPATQRPAVELLNLGETAPASFISNLLEAGISADGGPSSVLVVLVEDYLTPELDFLNKELLRCDRTWMLVKPTGRRIWVGPVFRPGRSACWTCLSTRLRLNQQLEEFVRVRRKTPQPLYGELAVLPATVGLAASLTTMEVARFLAGDSWIEGRIVTFDTLLSASEQHAVIKRPQCPVCGDPDRYRVPRPVVLPPVPKLQLALGIHRGATPEEIVEKLADQISPVTGVVSWIADTAGAGHGLSYNVAAGHNFVIGTGTAEWLHRGLSIRTGGKGFSNAAAKASAIGEAVERYSGVWRGEEPAISSSFLALGEEAIDPRSVLLFSERQYHARDAWNSRQVDSLRHAVPTRFDESAVIDWTPAWSLTHECFRYFPSSFCYYGHIDSATHFFCSADSNGCAAGNTLSEAIMSGFLELVERDAVAIWWYNRARRPAVDFDSFDSPYLDRLRAYYCSLHRDLWAIDISTDLGIPTYVALSRRTDRQPEDVIFGFGSHLEPAEALMQAVNELNQFLPAVSRNNEDGTTLYAWPEREAINWWKQTRAGTDCYLLPDPTRAATRKKDIATLHTNDVREDVLRCVEIAARNNLEVFVLDQSRADIPMAVCRVIVPGMRHFWRRLSAGRLYDVPVALGWLDAPVREEDLNPYSIFI